MSEVNVVVIENGSLSTRAGFANETLPSLIFPSLIAQSKDKESSTTVLSSIESKDSELYTILKDGTVYNWDALEYNWRHVFEKLRVEPEETPLAITEEVWNNKKNRLKLAELAFNKLQIPALTIIKSPLAITYGLGKATSLIIDIGAANVSVTPVFEGAILPKGAVHSTFAGDFLNLHVLTFLNKVRPLESYFEGSDSYKKFKVTELINEFKSTVLSISDFPIVNQQAEFNTTPKSFQLPDGQVIQIGKEQFTLTESLFFPLSYPIPGVELPQDSVGLTDLVLSGLKKAELSQNIYAQLLSNIVITGGSSLLAGLEKRLLSDLARFLPKFSIQSFTNPNVLERTNSTWIGAGILTSMNSFESFLSKEEFEANEDSISDKFK